MIVVLVLACLFVAFANGSNDVSKGIATLVGSGVSNYRAAILWGTAWTVVGALVAALLSQALVATFSGKGLLVNPETSMEFLLAVSCGAIGWLLIATRTGMPVSTTHSLAGSLVGTALVRGGTSGILWPAVAKKVAVPLLLSPVLSLVLLLILLPLLRRFSRRVDKYCLCVEAAAPALGTPEGVAFRESAPLPKVDVAPESQCGQSVARMSLLDSLHWLSAGTTSFFRGVNDAP
ncbi:MAG TPA: inorganic phosphate transporter, partial [Thermoanaerobaculia bacterium]